MPQLPASALAIAIATFAFSASAQTPPASSPAPAPAVAVAASPDARLAAWDAIAAEIAKVAAEPSDLVLAKDFHGLQPKFKAVVRNASRYDYSALRWRAELYLDGASTPAATTELFDVYKSDGGLKAGASKVRNFHVGFVTGDPAWITLEVQNAKRRVVKMSVQPESAQDFGERDIAGPRPVEVARPQPFVSAPAPAEKAPSGVDVAGIIGQAIPFGLALIILLAIANHYRRIARKRKQDYDWYIREFPDAMQGGRISCRKCHSSRIVVQRLMNRTYLRAHVCAQCGSTLYHSSE